MRLEELAGEMLWDALARLESRCLFFSSLPLATLAVGLVEVASPGILVQYWPAVEVMKIVEEHEMHLDRSERLQAL